MSRRIRTCLFGTMHVALVTTVLASSPVIIAGDVQDMLGARIPGAHIFLRADASGGYGKSNVDLSLTSDRNGEIQVMVGEGFYDLCVMHDAFTPQCKKLFIEGSKFARQHFRLKLDREVEKHIADKFQ